MIQDNMAKWNKLSRNRINSPNRRETTITFDLISEGPIEGLTGKGIYLDGAPMQPGSGAIDTIPTTSSDVNYTSSSNTITDNKGVLVNKVDTTRTQFITIRDGKKRYTTSDGTITISSDGTSIDTSTTFFDSTDISIPSLPSSTLNLIGIGENSANIQRRIIAFNANVGASLDTPIDPTLSITDMTIDKVGTIASINSGNNTLVIDSITEYGTDDRDVTGVKALLTTPIVDLDKSQNTYITRNMHYHFRKGTRDQRPITTQIDIGSASSVYSPSAELVQTDLSSVGVPVDNTISGGYESTDADADGTAIEVTTSNLNIGNQIPEVDLLKVTMQFPQMFTIRESNGTEGRSYVEIRIKLLYTPAGGTETTTVVYGPTDDELSARETGTETFNLDEVNYNYSSGHVQAASKTPFIEVFDIDLTPYQPLENFRLLIERVNPVNAKRSGRRHYNPSTVRTVEAVITDKLSYPLAAYSAVSFDAQNFSDTPERGYHVRGLKVKVPTNYFSRHELGEGQNASYQRNITTGAEESTYQNWDGNFRGDISTYNAQHVNHDLVWTDNPAWILYDVLTNKRYGLGEFINEADIDKYEFFRIARFCDELVDDGEGGTEPRFAFNSWIVERKEAYKLLTQLATVFRGMLHWSDGKITLSSNREKEPVYTFSKANVIDGLFNYQSTRERNRHNSIIVTWVDPKQLYKSNVEYVEDTENILETQQIRSHQVVAYGCTSRAQAHRYGKWYLAGEILETEVVVFASGQNARHLKAGDVIEIQDTDLDNIRYSGRVKTYNPEAGLTLDATYDKLVEIAGPGDPDPKYDPERSDRVLFAGEVTLPSSFSQDACMWEHGGTGVGSWLGVRDIGGVYHLTLRSGEGDAAVTATSADGIVTNVPIADIPEFDDHVHTVAWTFRPNANPGLHKLWIDGKLYIDDQTSSSAFDGSNWSGGDSGGWLRSYNATSGNLSTNDWPTTEGASGLRHYFGEDQGASATGNSTTKILIDDTVNLSSGNTFYLSLIYPTGVAYLAQDSATINSTDYVRGNIVLLDAAGNSINSATIASNVVDDSNAKVELVWSGETHVQRQRVTTTSSSTNEIEVASAFTSPPSAGVIWALTEVADTAEEKGSAKEYIITDISENSDDQTYSITAAEYAREKFKIVDRGYDLYTVPTVNRPTDYTETVPEPKNLTLSASTVSLGNFAKIISQTGLNLIVSWEHPESIRTDNDGTDIDGIYEHIKNYEILHNIDSDTTERELKVVNGKNSSYTFKNVEAGKRYKISVRLLSTNGTYSNFVTEEIEIPLQLHDTRPRSKVSKLTKGGRINSPFTINTSTGLVEVSNSTYEYENTEGDILSISGGTGNQIQQSFSGLSSGNTAYLVVDFDNSSDPFKAVEVLTDSTAQFASQPLNYEYLAEVGASNSGISSATGTVTVEESSKTVTGSGTTFNTDYNEGEVIVLGSAGATRYYAEIVKISSNTSLTVNISIPRAYSGASIFKLSYIPDYSEDTIIAEIKNTGGTYTIEENYAFAIGENSITTALIAANSIGTAQIAANSIGAAEISANSIGSAEISANSIGSAEISANSITSVEIAAGQVDTAEIAADAITNAKVAANAIDTAQIAANAVDTVQIAACSIQAVNIDTEEDFTLTVTDGGVGGWTIGQNRLKAQSNTNNTATIVALDSNSTNPYRIMAGGEDAGAPFSVDESGDVIAASLVLKKNGITYFDSQNGFTAAAISQIAENINARVNTYAHEASADSDDPVGITAGDTAINVTFTTKIDVRSMRGEDSSSPTTALNEIPRNIKLTVAVSSNANFSSNSVHTSQIFDRDTDGSYTDTDYAIFQQDLTSLSAGYIATVSLFATGDAVNADGDMVFASNSVYSVPASNTRYFKVVTEKGGGDGTTKNNPSTFDRVLEITDPQSVGFTVVGGSVSAGPGEGDITAVVAGSGLVGGASSGSATLNIGEGTGIDVAADEISVDVSDFMTNGVDNRVLTATGTDAMNAEANLTFDGTTLSATEITSTGIVNIDYTAPIVRLKPDNGAFFQLRANESPARLEVGHSTNKNLYLSNTGDATFNYDLTVTGNLTVEGTTTTLETATLDVEDKNITLNYSTGDSTASADGAGITIQDAVDASTDATILWDGTNDEFDFSHAINVTGNMTTSGNLIFDDGQITSDGTNFIFDGGDGKEVIISSARDVRIIIDDNNDDTNNEFQIFKHSSGASNKILNLTQAGALTINEQYTLPTADGSANQVLQTDGLGNISFASPTTGTVDTSGTPADNQIAVFTDADTIEGDSNFTWSGTELDISGSITASGEIRADNQLKSDMIIGIQQTGSFIDFDDDTTEGTNGLTISSLSALSLKFDTNNNDTAGFNIYGNAQSTPYLRIDNSGKVGIGAAPSEALHITDSTARIRLQDSDGTNQYLIIQQDGGNTMIRSRNNTSDGGIYFQGNDGTDNNTYGLFHGNGNFEIKNDFIIAAGTTNKQASDIVYIGGNSLNSADAAIYIGNNGSGAGVGWRFFYEGSGNGVDNKLIIRSENQGSPVDALAFDQAGNAVFAADVHVDKLVGNTHGANSFLDFDDDNGADSTLNTATLAAVGNLNFIIDTNDNESTNKFYWLHGNTAPSSATELMTLNESGNLDVTGTVLADKIQLGTETTSYIENLVQQDTDVFKFQTENGFISIGPENSSYAHIETDIARFYFNTRILVDTGIISSFNEDLLLRRADNSAHQLSISTTLIESSLPFTVNGDLNIEDVSPRITLTDSSNANVTAQIEATDRGSIILSADTQTQQANTIIDFKIDGSTQFYMAQDGGFYREGTGSAAKIIDANTGNLTNIGTIDASQTLTLNASGTSDTSIEIGANTASNHYAYIDLVGDATYTDYGLRIIRNNGGANTSSFIYHRGTGNFNIETQDSASIKLRTAGEDALTIDASQNATFAGTISSGAITATGNSNFTERLDIGTPPEVDGSMLHIHQENNSTVSYKPQLELYADLNTNSSYNNLGSITFSSNDRVTVAQSKLDFAEIRGHAENRDTVVTGGNNDGQLRFLVRSAGGLGEKLRITHDEVEVRTQLKTINGGTTLNYPTADGSDGQVLTTDGSGNITFESITSGTVDTTGTPADNQIAVFTDANTLEGDGDFTWNGTTLAATGDLQLNRSSTSGETRTLLIRGARNSTGNEYATLNFGNYDSNNSATNYIGASIGAEVDSGSSDGGQLIFKTTTGLTADLTERMRIDEDGNVGIGTDSPSGLLHVSSGTSGDATVIIESDTDNNDENDNPQLQFKQDGGNTIAKAGLTGDAGTIFTNSLSNAAYFGNDENASVQLYTNATAALTIREDGDVGIGTTSPDTFLDITGNGIGGLILNQDTGNTAASSRLFFKDSTRTNAIVNVNGNLEFRTDASIGVSSGTKRLVVNGNGNVGIGDNASPSRQLTVYNTSAAAVLAVTTSTSNLAQLALGDTDDDNYAQILLDNSVNKLQIQNGGGTGIANRGITIDANENIGIEQSSPQTRFQVEEVGINTTTTSTSSTTETTIYSTNTGQFRSLKLMVQVTNSTDSTYHVTEILLIHNGSTVFMTEYGEIFTGSAVEATFDADIGSGFVQLKATPASTDAMTFKVAAYMIAV